MRSGCSNNSANRFGLARGQIEVMQPSTVSIMPSGLEKTLTEAELADVIAYLQSLKAKSRE